jgi:hypothetical protein
MKLRRLPPLKKLQRKRLQPKRLRPLRKLKLRQPKRRTRSNSLIFFA